MMRLGIIGLGSIARTHLAAAARIPEVQIVAATQSRRASTILADYPDLRIYDTADALLNDDALEGVIVCVPTFLHEQSVMAAAQAGKHILCEKPIALDAAAAERMVDAAQKAGVTLMIGQVLRFWPEYVRIRALVREGRVGDVRAVSAWRLSEYPAWSEWFRDPGKSGGCLLDLQIHDVDFVYWLCGPPSGVYARGVQSALGAWDHVETLLEYGRITAHVEASFLMPAGWPMRMGLRVVGSDGALEFQWSVAGNVGERGVANRGLFFYPRGDARSEIEIDTADAYTEQLRYFVRQVERGLEPDVCPPIDSLAVMRIMTACRESVESGQPVEM